MWIKQRLPYAVPPTPNRGLYGGKNNALLWNFFKNITHYTTLPILRVEWMLRLANRVPGPLRGMLFRAALIFAVVAWDAEPKKPRTLFENCLLANIFLSLMGQCNHWFVWECENDRRHPVRYKILTKTFYFQFVGSCSTVKILYLYRCLRSFS